MLGENFRVEFREKRFVQAPDYVGDFVFQEPRREEHIHLIRDVVARCVQAFENVRKSKPRRVLIFRNDCSEGAFGFVLKYEMPLVKAALDELAVGHRRETVS